jgi:hypothetical protein
VEVDTAWIEELPEEPKAAARKRGKGPPPLPRRSRPPRRDTIEVKSEWLMPPLPEGHEAGGKPVKPTTHTTTGAKPRGKLPPPLPREEPESAGGHGHGKSKRPPRPSKRPPRSKH